MKIKALVSFFVAVCFVTVNVLAQTPVTEKKTEKAKTEKVEKKVSKDEKKDECNPKTCKDAKNAKKPCCSDKKPVKATEKK